jgi:major cell surface glycoprotein (TIGR04216 family)
MRRKPALVLLTLAVAMTLVAGLAAAQAAGNAPRGGWDTTASSGTISLDNSSYHFVYQGEGGIDAWTDADGDDVTGTVLERSSDGDVLELGRSVSRSQQLGRYESADGSLTAHVVEPRVSRLEYYNRNGVRLSSGGGVLRSGTILVRADWNFAQAEDVSIEVLGPDGVRVTREVLSTEPSDAQSALLPDSFSAGFLDDEVQGIGTTGHTTAYWLLDASEMRTGAHRVVVEGVEDLNFGEATRSVRVNVGTSSSPTLSFDRTAVSRGADVRFTVRGAEAGTYRAVGVPLGDVRSGSDPDDVFRFIGDTVEVGSTSSYAYAVVEVSDRGAATGGIETSHLERGDVSVRLFEEGGSVEEALGALNRNAVDRRSVTVERGAVGVSLSGGTYVTGQSVDVSGTASSGVDRIAVYVRERGDWELLPLDGRDTTAVRSDGTWRVRGVVLSEEDHGGRLLRLPGRYSIAAVDAAELSSPPPTSISSSEFSRLSTSLRGTVTTQPPRLVANLDGYGGEVAHGDRVRFTGTSVGSRDVVVAFVGERDVRAEAVRTTRGDTFDAQIDLDGMRSGDVTAFAATAGRDGEFGTGEATDADGETVSVGTAEEFRDYVRSFDRDGRTRSQKVDRIRASTVERAGSDDLIRTTTLRITDARTSVHDVVPAEQPLLTGVVPIETGETVLVRGTTNRNPEDTSIDVEVVEGPDADEIGSRTVETWSTSGGWSATLSARGVSLGSYTLRVDDGVSAREVSFSVVDNRTAALDEIENMRERIVTLRTELDSLETENDELRDRVAELEDERDRLRDEANVTNTNNTTDGAAPSDGEGLPGFTLVAALVALVLTLVAHGARRRS